MTSTATLPYTQELQWILHLADNCLILAQRNGAWCGHGPILEQDIAITNITLDLIGQARNFYQHAADLINLQNPATAATEDSLAYLRTEREFYNCLLVEQPNGDWGQTIFRQYLFSNYQGLLYQHLVNSTDPQIAAIAAKALREVTYHIRWSSEWVIRLGDGTEESKQRMQQAVEALWPFTGELFVPADYETSTAQSGRGVLPSTIQNSWIKSVAAVIEEATLVIPTNLFMQSGGKQGIHSEQMGYILSELQYLQRVYPGCEW